MTLFPVIVPIHKICVNFIYCELMCYVQTWWNLKKKNAPHRQKLEGSCQNRCSKQQDCVPLRRPGLRIVTFPWNRPWLITRDGLRISSKSMPKKKTKKKHITPSLVRSIYLSISYNKLYRSKSWECLFINYFNSIIMFISLHFVFLLYFNYVGLVNVI